MKMKPTRLEIVGRNLIELRLALNEFLKTCTKNLNPPFVGLEELPSACRRLAWAQHNPAQIDPHAFEKTAVSLVKIIATIGGPFVLLSAVSASAYLMLARMAEKREALDAGADVPEVGPAGKS